MIGGCLCVSCYNRQIEFRSGRNAKGTKPKILLAERRIGVIVDAEQPGERRRIDVLGEFTFDIVELVAQVLRIAVGRVSFTAPSYGETMIMGEFTKLMAARLPAKPRWRRRRLLGAARGRR